MSKENLKQQQPKLSTDSPIKTNKQGDIELTENELNRVSGGKHIAGVKYEDITVNCGTTHAPWI